MRAFRPLRNILTSSTISQQTFATHFPRRLITSTPSLRMMSSTPSSSPSSSNPSTTNSPSSPSTARQPAEQRPQSQSPPLPLPEPSSPSATQIPVGGVGVKLDHLGPLVVNEDGTLSRVGNWGEMAEIERESTLRILGKRNRTRMNALKARAAAEAEAEAEEWKGIR